MNEANNNAPSFDSKSNVESSSPTNNEQQHQTETTRVIKESNLENSNLLSQLIANQDKLPSKDTTVQPESTEQKMNWQKVAHKLREYNRKLLKKVFRLEQDLAETENKFNKQIDKARSSDLLVAQQAEEIKAYQEEISNFERKSDRNLSTFQQIIEDQKVTINNLTHQYEVSQQQTAQIERDCVSLQEDCNDKIYELSSKEQEIKDLKAKLIQQQQYAMQYKAELTRYQEQFAESNKIKAARKNSSFDRRSIKPWSISATSETKIALPQTKIQPTVARKSLTASETVKTAAQIATKKVSQAYSQEIAKPKNTTKSSNSKKPQSLAAVDLPSFPRPK